MFIMKTNRKYKNYGYIFYTFSCRNKKIQHIYLKNTQKLNNENKEVLERVRVLQHFYIQIFIYASYTRTCMRKQQ